MISYRVLQSCHDTHALWSQVGPSSNRCIERIHSFRRQAPRTHQREGEGISAQTDKVMCYREHRFKLHNVYLLADESNLPCLAEQPYRDHLARYSPQWSVFCSTRSSFIMLITSYAFLAGLTPLV